MFMKKLKENKLLIGALSAIVSEILFGLSFIFTKNATRSISTFALLGWRFFIGFIAMTVLIICGVIKINLKGKPPKPLLLIVLCNPILYFAGETLGIRHTTATESGIIIAVIPIVALFFSAIFLKKKPNARQVTGILVTLAGVLVTVFAVHISASLSPAGYIALLVAVLSYALYSVLVEKYAVYSNSEITYLILVVGTCFFGGLALGEAGSKGNVVTLLTLPFTNSAFAISLIYLGLICSVLAFWLINVAITNIGVNSTMCFAGINTIVSIVAGTLFLNEPFTIYQGIGAGIILSGVFLANYRPKNRRNIGFSEGKSS